MDAMLHWWVFLAVTVFSAGLALALIPAAKKVDLVDHPGHRKVHESVTPLTGGPAIYATVFAFLAWHLVDDRFVQALLAGGTIIFLAGLADDRKHLSPIVRFIVQVVACLVMVYHGNVYLEDFGRLFTSDVLELKRLAVPLTIFAALGVINAFNMIDGMDGLSGGIFMVAAAGMAMYAGFAGVEHVHWVLLAAIFAVLGFMLLNARFPWNEKARVFLGDSGSTLLGFVLAWCFIALGNDMNETGQRAYMPMTAVWLIAVPLMDTATLIWRRVRAGQSAFGADQHHLHHAFLRAGFSTGETWTKIMVMAIAGGVMSAGFELSGLPEYFSFWFFLACAITYYLYMRRAWAIQRFMGRDFIYNDFDEEE
ncbi:MAG: MraY family glycosyltransferase [Xanthomonadales bacterium]|jgi:UDP-GlcNAc:undecaprenyl-phosphate GlcNAc-1-phosphate transferase|nr:MraY family glycosyltransferase [Xanthomonadales bacterium]